MEAPRIDLSWRNRQSKPRRSVLAGIVIALLLGSSAPSAEPSGDGKPDAAAQSAERFRTRVEPFLKRFCLDCHGPKKQEGELSFQRLGDPADPASDRKTWERIFEALEGDLMPPQGRQGPSASERAELLRLLESTLYQIDCSKPTDPGRVTIRRLNRVEYNNTIRDLLGVRFRPADDFPTDDVGHGFDNIGDVLSVSPLLVEKYLAAAERIASEAVRVASSEQPKRTRRDRRELDKDGTARLLPSGVHLLVSRGAVRGKFEVPRRGEYVVRVRAAGQPAGPDLPRVRVDVDDKEVQTFDVEATESKPADYSCRVQLDGGAHRVSASFVNDYYNPDAEDPKQRDRNLFVHHIELEGPVDSPAVVATPDASPGLVLARPDGKLSLADAAHATLAPIVRRAFRRPVSREEVERHARFVQLAVDRGDAFERGVEAAVASVLVSPHFLFRWEPDPRANDATPKPDEPASSHPGTRPLNDYELATRLSYFLWSSMPDRTLFDLAEQAQLGRTDILAAQVKRMLADPKAEALAVNFGGQWLNLRTLDEAAPDPSQFPKVTTRTRQDFRRETELLFLAILRDDRPITEFLDADYTFVNERLAGHYGLEGISGEEFRRVSLATTPRAGVLTHASVLTLTSNPTRTSPVKRGKWILENILGVSPPDPPADVPQLEVTQKAQPDASLRQQLEIHRRDANCAVCHTQMDALGFGFENFDAVGRWRDREGPHPIDASGELPGGKTFTGPKELIGVLRGRRTEFARMLAGKLLTYSLGRGLEPADRCTIDRVVKQLEAGEYRFSVLTTAIVSSEPFRRRRLAGADSP